MWLPLSSTGLESMTWLAFKSPNDPSRYITPDQLADLYKSFIQDYPAVSIEDPFDQDDWHAWQKFTASADIQVVGDDLTVTSPKWIAKAADKKSCSCILLKVNQFSSETKSLQACKLTWSHWLHRSSFPDVIQEAQGCSSAYPSHDTASLDIHSLTTRNPAGDPSFVVM